jgi:hypothetical protein
MEYLNGFSEKDFGCGFQFIFGHSGNPVCVVLGEPRGSQQLYQ